MTNQTDPAPGRDRPQQTRGSDVAYRIAVRTAVVGGVFSLIVCVLLFRDFSRRAPGDPSESEDFLALKAELARSPAGEELKEKIRALDLALREAYFRRRAFSAMGAWLLLGGIACCLVAAKSAATLRRKLPDPGPQTTPQDVETQWTRVGRWSVGALTVALIAAAVGLSVGVRSDLPATADELQAMLGPPVAPGSGYPSEDEIRRNWPRFRGPGGSGISAYANVPERWDEKSGEGILWKTPVPLPGNNSPCVSQARVFLSGATKDQSQLYSFDADSGKLLWQRDVPGTPQSRLRPPKVDEQHTGYAAPTAVTDGRRVFAMFANGDVAAFDFEGKPAWSRSLGIPENNYGLAASPAMYQGLLLIQLDQGSKRDEKSKLLALAAASGQTVWEVTRKMPSSWGSPLVISHQGRDQVITCSDPWVIAYSPQEGKELWRVKCLMGDCGVSPVFGGGAVHVGNEYCDWSAIRPDGEGDVTESHVLWTAQDGLPDACSPLVTDQHLFLLASFGTLTCYDCKSGECLWWKDFDAVFMSSPSLVGERVYLFGEVDKEGEEDEDGVPLTVCKTWIIQPGPEEGKIVGECYLDEGCVTSPAFQDGRIYIRGAKHLYCLGKKGAP